MEFHAFPCSPASAAKFEMRVLRRVMFEHSGHHFDVRSGLGDVLLGRMCPSRKAVASRRVETCSRGQFSVPREVSVKTRKKKAKVAADKVPGGSDISFSWAGLCLESRVFRSWVKHLFVFRVRH